MGFSLSSSFMRIGMRSASSEDPVHAITLFVLLVCSCILIGHFLEKNRWITESSIALVVGLCSGTVILLTTQGKSSHILLFNQELFFIYLLPTIIFNAGFQVKKKQFFRNFTTIMLFGAIGTLISFAIIWSGTLYLFKRLDINFLDMGDYLALGAIFSATDSVSSLQVINQDETPLLYSLVFGEGVVNDATSVVLFIAIQKFDPVTSTVVIESIGYFLYLFLTSTVLGFGVGLLSSYTLKKLYFGRHSTDREVAMMILMAYLSYMMAELFRLSGILTVFFCGVVMSHYTWYNMTESSKITTRHTFATFSFVAEIFIFLYVGMDALDIEKWKIVGKRPWTSVGVSLILLSLVLVGRAAFVFPLSLISNLTEKSESEKISWKQQAAIWWAGLKRGAVSMALAYSQFTSSGHTQLQDNAVIITSTISVVLFTNLVCGLLNKPLMCLLLPQHEHSNSITKSLRSPLLTNGQDAEHDMASNNNDDNNDDDSIPRTAGLRTLLTCPVRSVHYHWRKFDDAVMRPVFGGRGFTPHSPHKDVILQ